MNEFGKFIHRKTGDRDHDFVKTFRTRREGAQLYRNREFIIDNSQRSFPRSQVARQGGFSYNRWIGEYFFDGNMRETTKGLHGRGPNKLMKMIQHDLEVMDQNHEATMLQKTKSQAAGKKPAKKDDEEGAQEDENEGEEAEEEEMKEEGECPEEEEDFEEEEEEIVVEGGGEFAVQHAAQVADEIQAFIKPEHVEQEIDELPQNDAVIEAN